MHAICSGMTAKEYISVKDGYLYYVVQRQQPKDRSIYTPRFINYVQKNLPTLNTQLYSSTRELGDLRVFTFLVINEGPNPVKCQLEMSPDGVVWDSFSELEHTLRPGQKMTFVPQYFLRYARVKYQNKNPGFNSLLTIWFQAQS